MGKKTLENNLAQHGVEYFISLVPSINKSFK